MIRPDKEVYLAVEHLKRKRMENLRKDVYRGLTENDAPLRHTKLKPHRKLSITQSPSLLNSDPQSDNHLSDISTLSSTRSLASCSRQPVAA